MYMYVAHVPFYIYKYITIFFFFSVTKHPNMKLIVTKEIEKLLYRPNIAIKAQ